MSILAGHNAEADGKCLFCRAGRLERPGGKVADPQTGELANGTFFVGVDEGAGFFVGKKWRELESRQRSQEARDTAKERQVMEKACRDVASPLEKLQAWNLSHLAMIHSQLTQPAPCQCAKKYQRRQQGLPDERNSEGPVSHLHSLNPAGGSWRCLKFIMISNAIIIVRNGTYICCILLPPNSNHDESNNETSIFTFVISKFHEVWAIVCKARQFLPIPHEAEHLQGRRVCRWKIRHLAPFGESQWCKKVWKLKLSETIRKRVGIIRPQSSTDPKWFKAKILIRKGLEADHFPTRFPDLPDLDHWIICPRSHSERVLKKVWSNLRAPRMRAMRDAEGTYTAQRGRD